MKEQFDVMLILSGGHAPLAMPYMYSLIINNNNCAYICFHVITDDLKIAYRTLLAKFCDSYGAAVKFYDSDSKKLVGLKTEKLYPAIL